MVHNTRISRFRNISQQTLNFHYERNSESKSTPTWIKIKTDTLRRLSEPLHKPVEYGNIIKNMEVNNHSKI